MPDDAHLPVRGAGDDLLRFVAPGLLHGMGNALFAIQGHCQMLGPERDPDEAKAHILEASGQARSILAAFRFLSDPPELPEVRPVGDLVADLGLLMRVPLREAGLVLDCEISPEAAVRVVPACGLTGAIAVAGHGIALALPTGFTGTLRVGVSARDAVRVDVRVEAAAGQLPFQVDLEPVRARCAAALRSDGTATIEGDGLCLGMRADG